MSPGEDNGGADGGESGASGGRHCHNDDSRCGLRERLTPVQYRVTQQHATERAFSGEYNRHYERGSYCCVVCDTALFSSSAKYNSGSGWPSFYDVLEQQLVRFKADVSHVGSLLAVISNPSLQRTEVSCAGCGAHLGHRFDDGPPPTGLRYCINSASLAFRPGGGGGGEGGDRAEESTTDGAAKTAPLTYFPGGCATARASCDGALACHPSRHSPLAKHSPPLRQISSTRDVKRYK